MTQISVPSLTSVFTSYGVCDRCGRGSAHLRGVQLAAVGSFGFLLSFWTGLMLFRVAAQCGAPLTVSLPSRTPCWARRGFPLFLPVLDAGQFVLICLPVYSFSLLRCPILNTFTAFLILVMNLSFLEFQTDSVSNLLCRCFQVCHWFL